MRFEQNTQNICIHTKCWDIIGTGRQQNVGRESRYYNAYFCPKCKKVYYEDYHFTEPIRLFYTKKGTVEYLKEIK